MVMLWKWVALTMGTQMAAGSLGCLPVSIPASMLSGAHLERAIEGISDIGSISY